MKTTVTNHTPGPWERNGNAVHKRLSKHYAECVAIVGSDNKTGDANLIAAAPELLEIADYIASLPIPSGDMLNLIEPDESFITLRVSIEFVLKAKAAIAKATGAS